MLCRLCGEFIAGNETSIGFGSGDGQDFVHGHCYVDYKHLNRVLSHAGDHIAMRMYDRLIEVHKTLIRQREQELK